MDKMPTSTLANSRAELIVFLEKLREAAKKQNPLENDGCFSLDFMIKMCSYILDDMQQSNICGGYKHQSIIPDSSMFSNHHSHISPQQKLPIYRKFNPSKDSNRESEYKHRVMSFCQPKSYVNMLPTLEHLCSLSARDLVEKPVLSTNRHSKVSKVQAPKKACFEDAFSRGYTSIIEAKSDVSEELKPVGYKGCRYIPLPRNLKETEQKRMNHQSLNASHENSDETLDRLRERLRFGKADIANMTVAPKLTGVDDSNLSDLAKYVKPEYCSGRIGVPLSSDSKKYQRKEMAKEIESYITKLDISSEIFEKMGCSSNDDSGFSSSPTSSDSSPPSFEPRASELRNIDNLDQKQTSNPKMISSNDSGVLKRQQTGFDLNNNSVVGDSFLSRESTSAHNPLSRDSAEQLLSKLLQFGMIERVEDSTRRLYKCRSDLPIDEDPYYHAVTMGYRLYQRASDAGANIYEEISTTSRNTCGGWFQGKKLILFLAVQQGLSLESALKIADYMLECQIIIEVTPRARRRLDQFHGDTNHFYAFNMDFERLKNSITLMQFLSDDFSYYKFMKSTGSSFDLKYEDLLKEDGSMTWAALLHPTAPCRLIYKKVKAPCFGLMIRGDSPCFISNVEETPKTNGFKVGQFVVGVNGKLTMESSWKSLDKTLKESSSWVDLTIIEKLDNQEHEKERTLKDDSAYRRWFKNNFGTFPVWDVATGTRILDPTECEKVLLRKHMLIKKADAEFFSMKPVYSRLK